MEAQYGDEQVRNFSFMSTITERKQIPCWLTYTNADTHKIIRDNLHLSGMFNGMIEASVHAIVLLLKLNRTFCR